MRALPPALVTHLKGTATTLCRCWQVSRTDGARQGFTDHDQAVTFDGLTHSALSGFASTGDVTRAGLSVGGLEIEGALTSGGLDGGDLAAGLYDFAAVSLWLVNWQDVTQRVELRRGTLGEIVRRDGAFHAEVRGPSQTLETIRGRVITMTCDADLGDARCGVDLAALAEQLIVDAVDGPRVTVGGSAQPTGWFAGGVLTVAGGDAVGVREAVVRHGVAVGAAVLTLRDSVVGLKPGDTVSVTPGCDKRFGTCGEKFANVLNFQGFPHLPGNDRALSYARSGS